MALEPTSPRVGQAVTATLTDEDGYIAGSVWTWEHRLVGGTTWTALTGSEDTAESSVYTPKATDLGKELRASVSYRDGHSTNTDMAESAVSAAVVGNQAPVITGSAAVPYAENSTVDVGNYTASDPDGHNIQWLALAGMDASHFELTGTDTDAVRALRFKHAPDYETKNTYSVALKVKDQPSEVMGTAEDPNASLTTTLEVMVTITNVEEAGSVRIPSTEPRVGHPVTATLADPDGQITGASWTWEREEGSTWVTVSPSGASGTTAEAYPELSKYEPQTADIGHRLRARVSYRDGASADATDRKSATSDPTASVVDVPSAPILEAVAGDGQVALTWQAPLSDGGLPILRYKVRYLEAVRRPGITQVVTGWKVVPGGAAARDTTIGGLTNGTAYIFRVLAENGVGSGARAEVTVTPEAPSCPITGPPKPTVAENTATTEAVATYTVSGDDCGTAEWLALGGTDKSAFALQGSGTARTLHFATAPDYETKRSYQVTVRLQVGSVETSLPVKVLVSNVDESGTVSMPSTVPRVGQSITATLTDLDGQVTGASWTWEREEGATWVTVWPSGAAGTAAESYPELSRYKPQAADIGHRLRARVSYRDPSSTDATDRRSAQSDPTASVVDVPSAPALTATAGDGQVALTWTAPSSDGGSPIQRYKVRYYQADLSDQAQAAWQVVPGGAAARDTTIGGLTNGTAYVFRVLAETALGSGARAEEEATPKAPVCSLEGPTQPTVAENTATTEAVATYAIRGADCGSATWLALGGTDASAFQLQGSGTSRTVHFLAAPDYETKSSYQVTVRLQVGSVNKRVAVTVAVSNVEETGSVTLTGGLPPQEDRAVVAQLTDPDGQITGASWTWQRRSSATAEWEAVPSGASGTSDASGSSSAELSRYTPQAADVGWQVRASVTYTDGQGPNKSRQSDASAAVIGKPGVPQDLAADPGDEQVALTWSAAAANGSPILRYHVRYYKADLSDQAEAVWHEVPRGATARDTTIGELPNDTAYLFQVLAENEVGRGVWAEKEATPKAPPCTLEGPTAATVAENTPTTTALATYTPSGDGCGSASWLALGGTDASSFALQGSGTSRTLHFLAAPDYETKNSYQVTVRLQAGSEEKSVAVAVAVANVEEAGSVALTGGLPPQEDRAVVAQLTDPDGQITGASWTWQRRSSATAEWEAVPSGASGTSDASGSSSAELSSYTPPAQDVGWQVRATVAYTDGQGPNKSGQSGASAAILGKPGAPQTVQAEPGKGQITLRWSAPASDGGAPITRYEYRESYDGGTSWDDDWFPLGLRTEVVLGGSPGLEVTLAVRAVNKVGPGPSVRVSATPLATNQAPTLEGPKTPSFTEHSTGSVGTYEASDPENDSISWLALGGADASSFQLQGSDASRTLHFVMAPDYETKSSYQVTVQVSDGSLTTRLEVTVSVSNVEEAGQVALTGGLPPQEDRAVVAQLTDPDGQITGASWTWQRRSSATAAWEAVSSGAGGTSSASSAELSSYTPPARDVGFQVRATVAYTDGQGPNKSAQSSASATILGKPGPPQDLAATPGDGQVTLRWSAPASDGGSPITGYAYRYSADGGTTWAQDWPTQANVTTTSAVVDGLTNGTTYTFQVRAHNNVGAGPAAQETAEPVEPPNQAPTLAGPEEPSGNEHSTASLGTYTARDPDGDALEWSLTGTDAAAFALQEPEAEAESASEETRTLHFDSAPDYETKSSYEVTVKVSDGSLSASVEVEVEVSNVDEAGTVALTGTPQVGQEMTATLSDPDGSVSNLRWRWLYASASGTAEEVEGANGTDLTSTFTPSIVVLGLRLQARALYDDGQGTGKSAESAQTEPVKGPPWAPQDFEAEPGDGQVELSWSAPSRLGGFTLQRYEYRRQARGGTWSDWTSAGLATEQTVSSLTNGTAYTFEVRAVNEAGEGLVAQTTATPEVSNRAPTLVGPEEPSGNENSTSSLGTYTASDRRRRHADVELERVG